MYKTSIFVLGDNRQNFKFFSWIKIFDKIKLLVLHFSDSLVVTPGVGQYLTPLGLSRISLNPQATLLWLRSIWFSIHISCFEMGARFPVFVFTFSEFVFSSSFLSVATLKQLSFGSPGDTILNFWYRVIFLCGPPPLKNSLDCPRWNHIHLNVFQS